VGLTIINTLLFAIGIYKWIVIAMVIFSWLYAFNVVNNSNRFVAMVGEFLYKATEPLLQADPPRHARSRRYRHFADRPVHCDLLHRTAHHQRAGAGHHLMALPAFVRGGDGHVDVFLRVTPNASRDAIEASRSAMTGRRGFASRHRAAGKGQGQQGW
jgi:hypothetical protein